MAEPDLSVLDRDIEAYRRKKSELEEHHMGKWVLFHDGDLIAAFDTLDNAAAAAVKQFGRGPYLIRNVGQSEEFSLPASVMYRPATDASG